MHTYYGYPDALRIPDDTRGYKFQPGFRGVFPGTLYQHIEIRINSKGLRDVEHDYGKKGKYRILGLGDSITFGAGIKAEDTYLAVLERLIKKHIDEKSDVIKAGVSGYEFDQECTYYFEEGYKYNPDIVMIGLFLNDAKIVDEAELKELKNYTLRLVTQDTVKESEAHHTNEKNFLRYFSTYKFLRITLYRLIHHQEIKAARDEYNKKYFYFIYDLWNGESLSHYANQLRNLNDHVKSKKSKVVLVLFPCTQQFQYAENMRRMPQEKIKALAEVNGIDVIDSYEILNRPDYLNFYLKSDNMHLNERGNQLVGEFIYNEMIKRGLVKL